MKFTFDATIDGLAKAMATLEEALDGAGCPMSAKTKLMVAMDEVASNIVHYSGATDFDVEIDFPEDPDAVRISFSDAGKAFNPLTEASAADMTAKLEDRQIGGLGMFMVKKMMDNVEYVHENGRNILTISKLRS